MLYRMRLANGDADPASSGTWIAADGTRARFSVNSIFSAGIRDFPNERVMPPLVCFQNSNGGH